MKTEIAPILSLLFMVQLSTGNLFSLEGLSLLQFREQPSFHRLLANNDDLIGTNSTTNETILDALYTNHTLLSVEKDPPRDYPVIVIGLFFAVAIVLCGSTLKRVCTKRSQYESIATELVV